MLYRYGAFKKGADLFFVRERLRTKHFLTGHGGGIRQTGRMPVRLIAVDVGRALRLAKEFGIYACDAYFLECANSNGGELLTLDKPMKRIAIQLGIRVLEP